MTVDNQSTIVGPILGTGATDTYNYPYRVDGDSHIRVRLVTVADGTTEDLELNTDFTLSGSGPPYLNGVDVVLTAGNLASTKSIVLWRVTPPSQEVDFGATFDFAPDAIEGAMDKQMLLHQEIQAAVERSLKLPVESQQDGTIETPEDGKVLKWDETAGQYVNSTYDPDEQVAEATAQATAAAASAVAAATAETAAKAAQTAAEAAQAAAEAAADTLDFPTLTGNGGKLVATKVDETGHEYITKGALASLDTVDTAQIEDEAITEAKLAFSLTKLPVRNTVYSSALDSDNLPDFISAGTGLEADIAATTTPVLLAFAAGFDEDGAVDYVGSIDADASVSGLEANSTNYLYAERDSGTGVITLGATKLSPVYGQSFSRTDIRQLKFEGVDGSTTITDEFGHTWTVGGNAQIDTDDPIVGTSSLLLDGTGDYIRDAGITSLGAAWSIACRARTQSTTSTRTVFAASNNSGYGVSLISDYSANLVKAYISTNGSAWNIANGDTVIGTGDGAAFDTAYHWEWSFDGTTHRIFLDGVEVYTKTAGNIGAITSLTFGASNSGSSAYLGHMDDIVVTTGFFLHNDDFTVHDGNYSFDLSYFNTTEMKMYTGSPDNWTEKQRVFLGEAVTDSTGVTSVVNYALNGQTIIPVFSVANSTAYDKSDNIGTELKTVVAYLRENATKRWLDMESVTSSTNWYGGTKVIYDRNTVRLRIRSIVGSNASNFGMEDAFSSASATSGQAYAIVRRAF